MKEPGVNVLAMHGQASNRMNRACRFDHRKELSTLIGDHFYAAGVFEVTPAQSSSQ